MFFMFFFTSLKQKEVVTLEVRLDKCKLAIERSRIPLANFAICVGFGFSNTKTLEAGPDM